MYNYVCILLYQQFRITTQPEAILGGYTCLRYTYYIPSFPVYDGGDRYGRARDRRVNLPVGRGAQRLGKVIIRYRY